MTPQEFITNVRERFGDKIQSAEIPVYDMVMLKVDRGDVAEIARYLFHDQGGRYVAGIGTDYRDADGDYLVDTVFSYALDHLFVTVRARIPEDDLWFESLTGSAEIRAANWAEREIQDLLGIKAQHHPDPRRLILADNWPENVHPLRRDVPSDYNPPAAEGCRQPMASPPKGATVVPVGPFFPVLEEPAYFRLFVEGERIVGCDYRGFYSHRGIEKLADSQLNYNQVPFLAERI